MPGILDDMTAWNWVGMAAVVLTYCIFADRLGRTDNGA